MKVQVKVLRKRLKLSDEQFASIVRKSGNSISAITKEASRATSASPSEMPAVAIAAQDNPHLKLAFDREDGELMDA